MHGNENIMDRMRCDLGGCYPRLCQPGCIQPLA